MYTFGIVNVSPWVTENPVPWTFNLSVTCLMPHCAHRNRPFCLCGQYRYLSAGTPVFSPRCVRSWGGVLSSSRYMYPAQQHSATQKCYMQLPVHHTNWIGIRFGRCRRGVSQPGWIPRFPWRRVWIWLIQARPAVTGSSGADDRSV